jgi:hypothetical protein
MMTDELYIKALDTVIPTNIEPCCKQSLEQGIRAHPKFEIHDGWKIHCLHCDTAFELRDHLWLRQG